MGMDTKDYIFTREEMLIVRDALIEDYQRLRVHFESGDMSEHGCRQLRVLKSLKEQFQEDCRRMK